MSDSGEGHDPRLVTTIAFGQGADAGIAIVRQIGTSVAIALSLKDDGDTEAILDVDSAQTFEAIRIATDLASQAAVD